MDNGEIDEGWDAPAGGTAEASPEDARGPAGAGAGRSDLWCVNVSDGDIAQMTTAEVMKALRAGKLSRRSLVWREGMAEWLPLIEVPALELAVSSSSPPPSKPASNARPPSFRPVPRPSLAPRPSTPAKPSRPSTPRATSLADVALSSLGSRPSPSPPSARAASSSPLPAPAPTPAVSNYTDYDADDDENTHVMSGRNLHLMQELVSKDAAQKGSAADDEPAAEVTSVLAVYDRPVATIAFPEAAAAEPEPEPPPPPPPPPPKAASVQVMPPQVTQPAQGTQPKAEPSALSQMPSVVVQATPLPAPSALPVDAPAPGALTARVSRRHEPTQISRSLRRSTSRTTIIASLASAIVASVATALLVRPEPPAPLVVSSVAPPPATAVAPAIALAPAATAGTLGAAALTPDAVSPSAEPSAERPLEAGKKAAPEPKRAVPKPKPRVTAVAALSRKPQPEEVILEEDEDVAPRPASSANVKSSPGIAVEREAPAEVIPAQEPSPARPGETPGF